MIRRVLITGASRGIGRALAFAFARAGWYVIGTYRREEGAAKDIIEEINSEGGLIEFKRLDTTCLKSIHDLFAGLPDLDAVVNNAGITRDALFISLTEHDWQSVMAANLDGVAAICREASERMCKRKRGVIINIGSSAAFSARIGQANYATTKSGILGYTRKLALEIAKHNVRALVVAPGYTITDMAKSVPEATIVETLQRIPLKRWGSTEEVAKVVLFAASDEAYFFTGQAILVDGGRTTYEAEFGV